MLTFLRTILLFIMLFVQACGSGGSSETDIAPIDKTYQFSLSSSYTNACGTKIPVTDVELILQDENWGKIESYYANDNGKISFTTTSQYINYTIVAKNAVIENGVSHIQGLDIASFYHTLSENDYQYFAPFAPVTDEDECQCVSRDLVLRHRSFASITQASSSLSYQSLTSIDEQTTQFNQVIACANNGVDWPLATFMVAGVDNNGEEIAAGDFLTDFSIDEHGQWQLAAVEVANFEVLNNEHDSFMHQQQFSRGQHFRMQVAENSSQSLVFDDHSYISESEYLAESSQLLRLTDSVFGSSRFESLHQKLSTRAQDAFSVEAIKKAPELDDSFYSEISSDGSYDYSAVSNYPMAIIRFDYVAYSPTTHLSIPVTWQSYGAISGTLPSRINLVDYQDIIDQDSDVFNTQVTLLRSLESNDYQDYLNFYQGIDNVDFNHDLLSYKLTLTVN